MPPSLKCITEPRLDAEEVHQGYGTTGGPDVSDDMVRLLR